MSISRETILLDNIKEALALYQRSLVWATTSALSGLLIAIGLREAAADRIPILTGTLSAPSAWAIAQALYLVFGALALSAIRRYHLALIALNPPSEILRAIRLYPSLATLPGRFFRLGSVLVPPLATIASWIIELVREHSRQASSPDLSWWLGMVVLTILLLAPYSGILFSLRAMRIWKPQPSASNASAGNGDSA